MFPRYIQEVIFDSSKVSMRENLWLIFQPHMIYHVSTYDINYSFIPERLVLSFYSLET